MQCKGSTVNLTVSPLALTPAILTCPSVAPFTYPVSPLQDAAGIAFAGYGGGSGLIFNASVSTGRIAVATTWGIVLYCPSS